MAVGHGEKLSRKRETAVAALLAEPTVGKAAARAGVDEKTLRRWLADPDFAAAYRAARGQVVGHAVGRLQRATGRAVRTLVRNLDAAKNGDQIKAAVAVIDRSLRAVELDDLMTRVEALEAAQARKGRR